MAVAGFGLMVFAAKLVLIAAYGTDVPYWDQWMPRRPCWSAFVGGGDWWSMVFRPHNEHHIVGTRLLTVDCWLSMVNGTANGDGRRSAHQRCEHVSFAVVGTGAATDRALALGGHSQPGRDVAFWLGEHVVRFQSQVYLVVFGGILALAMAANGKGGGVWAMATAAALAAGFSMAGGFLLAGHLSFWRSFA